MWFKNMKIYKFTDGFEVSAAEMNTKLADYVFKPCSSIEAFTQGFVPPNGQENGDLAYSANGFTLICLKRQEKIVPASVVKEQLEAKIAETKAKGGKVSKKDKESFKE